MAQTKPKAAQFYGVTGDGTAGQVLVSDGNGGMSWGSNTEEFTVSWNTPTGQSLTYTQPSPQSSQGAAGTAFPTTTFTATKSGEIISGTATIAGLPTGITATQSLSGSGADNVLTVTLSGVFPSQDSLNTDLTLSGLTVNTPLTIDYLIVAGGGGMGRSDIYYGGGGGGGGFRTSISSDGNGGGASSETALEVNDNGVDTYTITVGAGGPAAGDNSSNGSTGSNSVFSTVTSTGGGGGGKADTDGLDGGSGGGGGGNDAANSGGAAVSPTQGYAGGGTNSGSGLGGGGGGGAGSIGSTATAGGAAGGDAKASTITGSSVYFSAGGGGKRGYSLASNGASGSNWRQTNSGCGGTATSPKSGQSGIVIIKYPNTKTVTIGSGLTGSTTTSGSDKITTFTAGTGTITFS